METLNKRRSPPIGAPEHEFFCVSHHANAKFGDRVFEKSSSYVDLYIKRALSRNIIYKIGIGIANSFFLEGGGRLLHFEKELFMYTYNSQGLVLLMCHGLPHVCETNHN